MVDYNPVPNIIFFTNNGNPTVTSPSSPYEISFYQTRDSMNNPEIYEAFIYNVISRMRSSRTYTNYKCCLMENGLDHCQIHGNITSEMATLEMHHNILTIFDIAMIICEHILNTKGRVCTFDVIMLLKKQHILHRLPLIMMTETPHEVYHDDSGFWISPDQCFGMFNFMDFLSDFHTGITRGIRWKLINYLENAIHGEDTTDNGLFEIREQIINWSDYNDNMYYKGDCYR